MTRMRLQSGRGNGRASPLAARFLLSAGTLLGVGALLELGLRLFSPQPLFAYRFTPETWYEPTPSASFIYQRREFRNRIVYNGLGLRDHPVTTEKPPGGLRVVVAGDSFVEGLEVDLDETLVERLEAILREDTGFSTGPVEVVNLGVAGYSPVQSLRRLESLGLPLDPDAVVFVASFNDFEDLADDRTRQLYRTDGERLVLVSEHIDPTKRAMYAVKDFLKSHLMVYQFVRGSLQSVRARTTGPAQPGRWAEPAAGPAGAENALGPDRTMGLALRRMRDACRTGGICLLATMVAPRDTSRAQAEQTRFSEICAREGVAFVPLAPAFREAMAGGRRPFYQFDGHWNAFGHSLAARALAPHVIECLRVRSSRNEAAAGRNEEAAR